MLLKTASERALWQHLFVFYMGFFDAEEAASRADERIEKFWRPRVRVRSKTDSVVSPELLRKAIPPQANSPFVDPNIQAAEVVLLQTNIIAAIKAYRERTGCSLLEAKNYLEALRR